MHSEKPSLTACLEQLTQIAYRMSKLLDGKEPGSALFNYEELCDLSKRLSEQIEILKHLEKKAVLQ